MAIARLEKPHCGNRAVPFMKSTTSFDLTMSPMRLWASVTFNLHIRHCGFELQCVKLSPYAPPERGIDCLMLLDAAHSGEAAAYHARGIMVPVAGEVADGDLGIRDRRLDQFFDVAGRHRHQRFEASMICRRASTSLWRSASRIWSSSHSTPAAVRSPSTLRITSCSPASSKSERTTSLAYDSVSASDSPICRAAHSPSRRLRRAVMRKRISSSCANLDSKARSRSLNWVMRIPCHLQREIGMPDAS